MDTEIYLNLTNGLEYLAGEKLSKYKVIRIQSTSCEQKRWDSILAELDYNFLFDLAIGKKCIVVDYSSKKDKPRAIYQGLEWIKYVINRIWFNREIIPYVRGTNVTKYFRQCYRAISKSTRKKIKYFRKFLLTDEIKIEVICQRTNNDNNIDFYKSILKGEK